MKQIHIRLTEEVYDKLKELAEEDRRSMASLVEYILSKGLRDFKKELEKV